MRAKDSFEGKDSVERKDSVEGKESVEDKGLRSGQRNQLRANDSVDGKLHRHLLPTTIALTLLFYVCGRRGGELEGA